MRLKRFFLIFPCPLKLLSIVSIFIFLGYHLQAYQPLLDFSTFTLITPCFVYVCFCTAFSVILSNFPSFILLDNPYLILKYSESSMQAQISLTTFHMQNCLTSIFVFALVTVPKFSPLFPCPGFYQILILFVCFCSRLISNNFLLLFMSTEKSGILKK